MTVLGAIGAALEGSEEIDLSDMDPPEGSGDLPPPGDQPPDPPEAAAALFERNDLGNGRRLVHYFGQDFLWVPRLGWLHWDGKRWAADEDEIAIRRDAHRVSRKIQEEIPFIALDEWERAELEAYLEIKAEYAKLSRIPARMLEREEAERLAELELIAEPGIRAQKALGSRKTAHRRHAEASGNTSKISNMITEAGRCPGIATLAAELNSDPLKVCVQNGVLQFSRRVSQHDAAWGDPDPKPLVEILPHKREQRITKIINADYYSGASRQAFEAFLKRVIPDPEVRAFLKRWFGYCLTGDTTEQALVFLYGGGRNGKSTLVDLIAEIMADYGTTIPIESLTGDQQRKGSDATPDLVRLPGARFVRASEPEQGQKMREALIKQLTGGEAIMIRRMMQEFVEVQPEFKLTISGNYKPEVRGADDGIWRRIMLVPFLEQIPIDEVDRDLPAKLRAERDGVLAWMVEGCLEWLQRGLCPPETILEATDKYRLESDPFRDFLLSECEITGTRADFVKSRELFRAFNAWLIHNGQTGMGSRTLSNRFRRQAESVKSSSGLCFEAGRRNDTSGYFGLQIKQTALVRADAEEYAAELARIK